MQLPERCLIGWDYLDSGGGWYQGFFELLLKSCKMPGGGGAWGTGAECGARVPVAISATNCLMLQVELVAQRRTAPHVSGLGSRVPRRVSSW